MFPPFCTVCESSDNIGDLLARDVFRPATAQVSYNNCSFTIGIVNVEPALILKGSDDGHRAVTAFTNHVRLVEHSLSGIGDKVTIGRLA